MKRMKKRMIREEFSAETGEVLIRLHNTLRWRLSFFILEIVFVSGLLTSLIGIIALAFFEEIPAVVAIRLNPYFMMAILIGACIVISTPLSIFFGKYYLKPIKNLISATKELKKGNFEVRVPTTTTMNVSKKSTASEIDLLICNFNEMAEELGGIEMFRNDFINNFSHEFKTPIVSIRGFARQLQHGDLSREEQEEYARIIAEEADRLARLSNSVLELSKLEHQQIVSNKTRFHMDEQIRQCILRLESEWSDKEIDMIPELEAISFVGNEEMLAHVWSNLIGNAIKFTPTGGTVTVRLTADAHFVTVTVSDTGIGMSEETEKHIFEKFYQGDRSHSSSGYGIGLALVDRIVKLCGGSVTVKSEIDAGSEFTIRLPIAQ
jgi:signal transduction histidine kinase